MFQFLNFLMRIPTIQYSCVENLIGRQFLIACLWVVIQWIDPFYVTNDLLSVAIFSKGSEILCFHHYQFDHLFRMVYHIGTLFQLQSLQEKPPFKSGGPSATCWKGTQPAWGSGQGSLSPLNHLRQVVYKFQVVVKLVVDSICQDMDNYFRVNRFCKSVGVSGVGNDSAPPEAAIMNHRQEGVHVKTAYSDQSR